MIAKKKKSEDVSLPDKETKKTRPDQINNQKRGVQKTQKKEMSE